MFKFGIGFVILLMQAILIIVPVTSKDTGNGDRTPRGTNLNRNFC